MANTNATTSWRAKWASANLQESLKATLVAEKICRVDRGGNYYIWNPYISQLSATVQAVVGTYAIGTHTTVDDTLTVTDEFYVSDHIYDFEKKMQHSDIFQAWAQEAAYAVSRGIDKWVLNNLCEDGTGTYTTPAGGFTTAANINGIISKLGAKFSGYADIYNGLFLVIEAADTAGFTESGMASGFSFADSALRNGFMKSYGGFDIYAVIDGTFVSATLGSTAVTNSGHRVAGVKSITTYASPRGIEYEEFPISGSTGREVVMYGYCGFKAWYQKKALIIDITIA
uniref:Putative capsid protein n=1 Tax=viral metagenome TaxID=1070528 RepID=A0A6H1ZS42_9ZZZZ